MTSTYLRQYCIGWSQIRRMLAGPPRRSARSDTTRAIILPAVVGYPHEAKGEGIFAYVTLMIGDDRDPQELLGELIDSVRTEIGPIAKPDIIQWAPGLPKTRSGKIMRRLLRKIASDELDSLGDTSTLADPSVVEELIANRQNR